MLLMQLDKYVVKKGFLRIYCEVIFVPFPSNNATYTLIKLLHGMVLGGSWISVKGAVTNNVEDFLNMDETSCDFF